MNVLGPYQFLEANETDECGCGGEYCALLQNNDKIAFQIAAADNCCSVLTECESITQECVDDQNYTLIADAEISNGIACGSTGGTDVDLIAVDIAAEINKTYLICICVTTNEVSAGGTLDLQAFVGSDNSAVFTGTGNFCIPVTFTGATATVSAGIRIPGTYGSNEICFSCFSICLRRTWEATLIDENGTEILTLNQTNLDNGNIAFQTTLTVPSEVPHGCYQVKLEDDCGDDPLYSQCLKITTAQECTLLFKYRDTKNVFGFDYLTDTAYYNFLRVKAKLKFPTYPDDSGVFRLSDNSSVLTNAVIQKVLTVALDTPGVPDYVHDAMAVMRRHQEFLIDSVEYIVAEGDYAPEWRKSSNLAASSFEVMPQNFDGVNSFCG